VSREGVGEDLLGGVFRLLPRAEAVIAVIEHGISKLVEELIEAIRVNRSGLEQRQITVVVGTLGCLRVQLPHDLRSRFA
jgi:hypothetical protein